MPPSIVKQNPLGPKKAAGTLADRFKPIGFTDSDPIKVLFYGESGTGKTTIAATFPSPILWVTCSGGLEGSGELRSVDTADNRTKITQVELRNSGEMKEALAIARARKFNTIVLDHISGLQGLTFREILGIEEIPAVKEWGLISQQQYGQSTTMCIEYVRSLLNMPCNTVTIAQERIFKGKEDGITDSEIIKPAVGIGVTPGLAAWVGPAHDYVIQTFIRPKMVKDGTLIGGKVNPNAPMVRAADDAIEYCARTARHDCFAGKFRVPKGTVLPKAIVDPDYSKIIRLIRGGK